MSPYLIFSNYVGVVVPTGNSIKFLTPPVWKVVHPVGVASVSQIFDPPNKGLTETQAVAPLLLAAVAVEESKSATPQETVGADVGTVA